MNKPELTDYQWEMIAAALRTAAVTLVKESASNVASWLSSEMETLANKIDPID